MSSHLPNGQFPPGVSGNPGGRVKGRPSVTKLLRGLLDDNPELWARARLVEAEGAVEGEGERLKVALNLLRRSKFDNAMAKELLDRVDGKLAPAYMLPDDDDNVQIVRPVLYVAPPEAEKGKAERLFSAFDIDGPEPEAGGQAETQPRELAETKGRADPAGGAAATPTSGRPERFFRALDIAGHELDLERQTSTLPPARGEAPEEHIAGTGAARRERGPR